MHIANKCWFVYFMLIWYVKIKIFCSQKVSFIQLSYKKVIKKDTTLKLTNFPRNHNALALFPFLRYLNNIKDSEFQWELISTIENNDDLQKYIF